MIYFYSYVWQNSINKPVFENEISRKHPLLIVRDWHDKNDGNNRSKLLFYHEIGDEQLGNIELQHYLDYSLENYGELFGSKS